jgi:hypothetical protein
LSEKILIDFLATVIMGDFNNPVPVITIAQHQNRKGALCNHQDGERDGKCPVQQGWPDDELGFSLSFKPKHSNITP